MCIRDRLGKVKEVREVYNCPPEEKDTQYEKTVCYKGAWEDYACNGEFRQQRRTVLNCPVGTSSTKDIVESRAQYTTMDHCYNIQRVTNITVEGTGDLSSFYFRFVTMRKTDNGEGSIKGGYITWNKNSPAGTLDFDPPRDIVYVFAHCNTYGKDANVYIKFWDGDFLIRSLHKFVPKNVYYAYQWNNGNRSDTKKEKPKTRTVNVSTNKPMIEGL